MTVPRRRRLILDADGMYDRPLVLERYDRNHAGEREHAEWRAYYRHLADRILQPTFTPREPGVEPLLFYGYDADALAAARPEPAKVFDILHVAHNWWRWREVSTQLLPALEGIRDRVGAIAFVGLWWDAAPPWARGLGLEAAFCVDPARLDRLRIEVRPPVPFRDVIPTMSAKCGIFWGNGARPCRRKPATPCRSTLPPNAKRCSRPRRASCHRSWGCSRRNSSPKSKPAASPGSPA